MDAVSSHGVDSGFPAARAWAVDDLGVHAGLHSFEHVTPSEVDRRAGVPIEANLGLVRGDHRFAHAVKPPAREVVRLQLVGDNIDETGFHQVDLVVDDHAGLNLAKGHGDELQQTDVGTGELRLNPQAEDVGNEIEKQHQNQEDHAADDPGHRGYFRQQGLSVELCAEHQRAFLRRIRLSFRLRQLRVARRRAYDEIVQMNVSAHHALAGIEDTRLRDTGHAVSVKFADAHRPQGRDHDPG